VHKVAHLLIPAAARHFPEPSCEDYPAGLHEFQTQVFVFLDGCHRVT
jgi:hypothetical protein